ncbi:unnamed protein product, partial [Dovyalis caffra]
MVVQKLLHQPRRQNPKSENGSNSTRETLVNELKVISKKGVSQPGRSPLLVHLLGSPREKMDAPSEASFDGVAKGFRNK